MFPPLLKRVLLMSLALAFVALPSVFAQRRVFTNDDISRTPPPAPAPAAPAETAASPVEGTPSAAGAPAPEAAAAEGAASGENLPQGLALAEYLQGVLRRYHTEIARKLDLEVDVVLEERWRTMMNLAIQLIAQNQVYINELHAQQQQAEAEAEAQAGAQPAP
jgi:hypothetical protein